MSDRSNLIELAVEQLRSRIRSGEWKVGERIPTEPLLVELLGVGRNTVREAVQSLVHSGLLIRRQGSGTYVKSTSEMSVAIGRQFEDAHYVHILEVRRSLEVEAARLAARNRTDKDIAAIRTANQERHRAFASGDLDGMVSADMALHNAIASASKNPVLASLYESLTEAVSHTIRMNVETILRSHVNDDHDDLVDAIIMGDPFLAMEEMGSYLENYIESRATPRGRDAVAVR
ncbi:FadR/GntR family transcriptional regulator [Timonella senegalensis]|uniref:FadR/GntR family transcriptional regulator n=1 Tax=Timonella senegalensis TaxID=1465825 RepID=UPI0028A94CB5|nr:FadR/GntR family transcriptional regulator [Timonella senegalensis]